ncbi:MAG: response regulator [Candidatus Sericytochromatia bacterium]
MIVEDSRFIQQLLQHNIAHLEMELAGTCNTRQEALALYAQTQPDAVIIDYNLPQGNGPKLIEELLVQDIYARLIVLVPSRLAAETQNLIAMGIKAVVVKPFYPEILQSTLIEVAVGL